MTNIEKYKNAFVAGLELPPEEVKPGLAYQETVNWDSVGHMALIAELEDAFEIVMDTDDIIDFSSYEKGLELLGKYGIVFE